MSRMKILYFSALSFTIVTSYAQLVNVPSINAKLFKTATLVQTVESEKELNFAIWMKFRNKNKLDQVVKEIYDPEHTNFQKYLSYDEIEKQFAPIKEKEQVVLDYFLKQGFKGNIVNHTIRLSGTVEQIQNSLHINLNYYKKQNKVFFASDVEPKVRADIAPYIDRITGLNNTVQYYPTAVELPHELKPVKGLKPHNLNFVWKNTIPPVQPTTRSIGGFTGANLRTAYNVANIPPVNGVPIDGLSETVVITANCGKNSRSQILAEANTYNTTNGLPILDHTNFAIINADGTPYTTCPYGIKTGWETEIALDIQAVHTMAPSANIVVVLSQHSEDLALTLIDTIATLAANSRAIAGFANANTMNNSWGTLEVFDLWPLEIYLEIAAANGINLNFSTGNCGDNTYNSPNCTSLGSNPQVLYPASSAYTTAVGGTSLFVDNSWHYAFETVWGTFFNNKFSFGSSGGISKFFNSISWQSMIQFFIAGGYGSIINNNSNRALPDISMVGDPITGLMIYHNGAFRTVGGTALANALFSGIVALVNESRSLNLKQRIGFFSPYFYINNSVLAHSNSINLITAPHQIISGASVPPPGAPTSAFTILNITYGWDSSLTIAPEQQFWNDAVGIGTPNIVNFVQRMALLDTRV